MTVFRADLHVHSSCSDGSFSPTELVSSALKKGLGGLSITDHDTIAAYEDALPFAKRVQLPLISGIEISSTHQGMELHILGYAFDLKNEGIRILCQRQQEKRRKRLLQILELLKAHHLSLSEEKLLSKPAVGRPDIAQALFDRGAVRSLQEAFDRWLGTGQPCFVKGDFISTEDAIAAIHKAGGIAILAHPQLIKNKKSLRSLFELNLDGLECYYGRFDKATGERWRAISQEKGWMATGGSDFHGKAKPHALLGSSWTNEETFRTLLSHFEKAQT